MRTWCDISLDNLEYNINQIKSKLKKGTKLCGIVSEGMIVCAEDKEGKLAFLTPEKDIEDGSQVF